MLRNKLQTISAILKRNFFNIQGWRTNRKLVVIESDDWGSIRMPSKKTYDLLLKSGLVVNECPFSKYDSLASENDLENLFETLIKFKDNKGNPPIITANTIVANPNFQKIKESKFETYYFERFTETLKKYPKHSNSFSLWKEGQNVKLFYPQLHGREHLFVNLWMKKLQSKSVETLFTFDHNLFGISAHISQEKRLSYLQAFNIIEEKDLIDQEEILVTAQNIFNDTFNYKSESFIFPNYTWNPKAEAFLNKVGVKYIQGLRKQSSPSFLEQKMELISHYTGEKNRHNQFFLTRNCFFEPSIKDGKDCVDQCLSEINTAFKWKKPAIISSHRLNYIGYIDPRNSSENLILFEELIKRILKKWKNIEFITTDQLGAIIHSDIVATND